MKIRSLLPLLLLLLIGCSRDNAGTSDADTSGADTPDSNAPRPTYLDTANQAYRDSSHLPKSGGGVVLVKDIAAAGLKNDQATISEAYATEKGAQLRVSYGGGCREHSLALYALETLEKGETPVGRIYLSHDAGGDNCEALITTDVTYDLTPLIAYYRDVEKQSGPVRLMIYEPGGKEPAQSITVEVK